MLDIYEKYEKFCEKIMSNLQEMVVFSFSNDEQS